MKTKLTLFFIVILALFIRVYHLSQIPPALYWDEASLGYNAYSIATTGHDEHGIPFPVSNFAAFGDYKAPGYVYVDALTIRLFGLSEFTIRLPSALSGTILVLVTYFVVEEIINLSQSVKLMKLTNSVSLLSALFVALSPWAIQMSRAAFESNLATLFSASGILFFLRAVRLKGYWFFFLSAIFLALSMYTFNAHRVFVPLMVVVLALIFRRELLIWWRQLLFFGLSVLLLLLPLIPHLLSPEGRLRFNEVSWVNDVSIVERSNQLISDNGATWWAKLIYNRRAFYTQQFFSHYFDHFKFDYLFLTGDINPRLSTRTVGEFYLFDLLFLIPGVIFLVKIKSKIGLIIISWIALGLVPAAIARETPHALRTLTTLPIPQIIVALGLIWLAKLLSNKKKLFQVLVLGIVFGYEFFLISYLYDYYFEYPIKYASDWQYGYKQAVEYTKTVENKYDHISVTNSLGRPYIYFLLYNKFPPEQYWDSGAVYKDRFGFWTVDQFDKYVFSAQTRTTGKWLYIRASVDTAKNAKIFHTIRDPNGAVVFNFYDNF